MITRKLISKEIQTITLEYSGAEALAIMQEYHLSHLAILSNNELLGIICEEDIWAHNAGKADKVDFKPATHAVFRAAMSALK